MRSIQWLRAPAGAMVLATGLTATAAAQTADKQAPLPAPGTAAPAAAQTLPPLQSGPLETILVEPMAADGRISTSAAACNSSVRTSWLRTWWDRCRGRLEERCVSQEPDPLPLGTSMYEHFGIQVKNGIAARMTLHEYDFEPGKAALNVRGSSQLTLIHSWAARYPLDAIIIELTPNQARLAEQRRLAVLKELNRRGTPLPDQRVVVGAPRVPGLNGVEAESIYYNLLNQTQSQGAGGGGVGSGSSGAGASAGNGSGAAPTSPGNR